MLFIRLIVTAVVSVSSSSQGLSTYTLPTNLGFSTWSLESVCVMLQVFPGWNGETKPFKCMFIARLHVCTSASSSYTLGLGYNHELTGVESPNCPDDYSGITCIPVQLHMLYLVKLLTAWTLCLECKHKLTSVENPSCSVKHWRLNHQHYACLLRH